MKVDFFIVGAPKAGTTSLYNYLDAHQMICMSSEKEPNFFSYDEIKAQNLYYKKNNIKTQIKYNQLFNKANENQIAGEASVSYLFYKNVPKKIKKYNPNAKIIIILRNPIQRAFSHYLMDKKLGLVNDSLEKIIDNKPKLFYQQYIELGLYCKQIKRYYDYFDKKNILIINYDDFNINLKIVLKDVFQFLNLELDKSIVLSKKYNTYARPKNKTVRLLYSFIYLRNFLSSILPNSFVTKIRSSVFESDKKPNMSSNLNKKLKAIFLEDIKELSKICKTDYNNWLN